MSNAHIKRLDAYRLEILPSYRRGMLASAIVYADAALEKFLEPAALDQAANTATLPGLAGNALAMPDIHTGYGFPIGGVAAFDAADGVISPGGVGYDINCGVRLLATALEAGALRPRLAELVAALHARVPAGLGAGGGVRLDKRERERPLVHGAAWAVERGLGRQEDLACAESGGAMSGADPHAVSRRAQERGQDQLGTLGSGNHFLEVQEVTEIFDEAAAGAFGLFKGQVTLMLHSGSRGLGHQVCGDFTDVMRGAASRYGITLADPQLAAAPFRSDEGRLYFGAMQAAANFAWANRQALTGLAREVFGAVLGMGEAALDMRLVYDVAHNIAKLEEHVVNGKKLSVVVHRKGATRAFAPGHPELPPAYARTGQPVIIPGDMGRASYLLAGTQKAMAETFGSACHGAGRLMSRHEARRCARGRDITNELLNMGVSVRSADRATLAEEMPEAYKDVAAVVGVIAGAGIARKVAKFRPLCVIKG
ncbi:MAG TPA: RNA-splicing ligase RtcB [Elusimicrobia bacterium]|nr:MAG: RNA-splicing ligase RtcB [Elusimicrobia bacterium GWF2_62_30]HBA62138.1 RNA-splicing ligase RtcB [Elusimicrobiota bacterium]